MYGKHLMNHIHGGLLHDETLHVIRVVSNPARYHSRYRLARQQEKELLNTPHVKLYTVETAYGDRHHEVTEKNNPMHLQLRTHSEIWIKENMINLGVKHLIPRDAKYIAWVDADVSFDNPNWALETIHQLQHFAVVQPWSDCVDLGPHGTVMAHFRAFGMQHQKRIPKQKWPGQKEYQYAHTGFAWACTRKFWEATQGLMDFCILGSADHHMAFACINEVKDTIHGKMGFEFHRRCLEWQTKAYRITMGEVGYVEGMIKHHFHGSKKKRYYRERWQILFGYDPAKHLMYDEQGLIQLVNMPRLEHDILQYNRSRHEDSVDE